MTKIINNAILKNDRFLRSLAKEPVDRTPVWMMRQAGRHLPEYKKVRKKVGGFKALYQNSELACEVTLQPLDRYPLDAAILFSDILTIPDAMGLGLYFEEGEGPKFRKTIRTEKDIVDLGEIKTEVEFDYVFDSIKIIQRELNGRVPLIGFSGSPWTLACYMVEGGPSKNFRNIKHMMYETPELLHQLLDKLSLEAIDYLNAQIAAGVQAVQIFDTWGGVLSHSAYHRFSLPYMEKIVKGLIRECRGQKVPVILFTKGSGSWLESMSNVGADALGLDWNIDIGNARAKVGDRVSLQGNLDPYILFSSRDVIRQEVRSVLESYGKGSGHIFNLGHGIDPLVDPERVKIFVEAVHEYSVLQHEDLVT